MFKVTLILAVVCVWEGSTGPSQIREFHPDLPRTNNKAIPPNENAAEYWNGKAAELLQKKLSQKINQNEAKNVILFLGDGMSVPTLAATRVYHGDNENTQLSFEAFPHTAISKTYCVDKQVADSACTATAYLGGVKANYNTIGVTGDVLKGDCDAMNIAENRVNSIAYYAQLKGKSSGLVTTTEVTDASPAGVYAHVANRAWKADTDVVSASLDPKVCKDIANQLITDEIGSKLEVILGGGRRSFFPRGSPDPAGDEGYRSDSQNLVDVWTKQKEDAAKKPVFVYNKDGLLQVDTNETDYLLGLFTTNDMEYNLDRDTTKQPSLDEMTSTAIKILQKNPNGFFLFVESGLIDHGHHETKAHKALNEAVELTKAVDVALQLTSEEDTLIVVTSDHAHTMSFSGYADRGNDIFHTAGTDSDKLAYATLNYANGPGYKHEVDGHHADVLAGDLDDKEYEYPAVYPLGSETHGGDDVIIFANGPWSHLFTGVLEQNVIPHLMKYASCLTEDKGACAQAGTQTPNTETPTPRPNKATITISTFFTITIITTIALIYNNLS